MAACKAITKVVRVLIIDNDPLVLLGAKALLNQQPGWVVHSAEDCVKATELCLVFKPNVMLLGINHATDQDINNIQTLKRLRIPVIAYGATTELGDLHKLLAAGADAFIHRSVSSEALIGAINDCMQGRRTILTGNESDLLYEMLRATRQPTAMPSTLTSRERDVLACVLQGMSNAEIASHLSIKAGTVKAHIGRLLRKYGVTSRTKLAIQVARRTQHN